MKKIYFLCTGNSCRSQIADGLAQKIFDPNIWEIRSAGIEAHGLNKRAIQVMAEIGIDISQNKSEVIDVDFLNDAQYVITLCGDALDNCPVIPAHITHEHWDLLDPAKAVGTEEEIMEVFRTTRHEIQSRLNRLAEKIQA